MTVRVALIRGNDRFTNILRALESIEKDIRLGERIVVKPNMVSVAKPLSATHADALRAVLEFLKARTSREITIAEGTACSDTRKGFARYGYCDVARHYGAKLVDLNRDRWAHVDLVDRDFKPLTLRVARTIAESDCRISLAPMKTHDTVVVTLSLKNLVMGSLIRRHRDVGPVLERILHTVHHKVRPRDPLYPRSMNWIVRWIIRSDKLQMHQTYPTMNINLYRLAKAFPAHLAVLDGFTGMEGPGPTSGNPVDLRVALASTDFIACDSVGARVMGFDPEEIGYLHYAMKNCLGEGDLEKIEILGERIEDCRRPFEPHPLFERQLTWRLPAEMGQFV